MNKIQVGYTPSPNLKQVKSKIGSLENSSHKPGGGNVKIENRKVEIKAAPRIEAKNERYVPKGGDKKVTKLKDLFELLMKFLSPLNTKVKR